MVEQAQHSSKRTSAKTTSSTRDGPLQAERLSMPGVPESFWDGAGQSK